MRDSALDKVRCGREKSGHLESFGFSLGFFLHPEEAPSAGELASGAKYHLHCVAAQLRERGSAFPGLSVLSLLRKLESQ